MQATLWAVRVISGTARGIRLDVPPGDDVRPTIDRVREATFNALFSLGLIEDANVVDLFGGTGALGIEALSRGARHAVFVEANRSSAKTLEANLGRCQLIDSATVVVGDAFDWIGRTATGPSGQPFDLALLDPPYRFDDWPRLLDEVPAAAVVIESNRPVEPGPRFVMLRQRKYGTTVVTIAEHHDRSQQRHHEQRQHEDHGDDSSAAAKDIR